MRIADPVQHDAGEVIHKGVPVVNEVLQPAPIQTIVTMADRERLHHYRKNVLFSYHIPE